MQGILKGLKRATLLMLLHTFLLTSVAVAADDPLEAIHSPMAVSSLLLDGVDAGGRLVVVGERGHVLLSDDKGDSWRQAKQVQTRATLTAVDFRGREFGLAVGHDAVILRSSDGGERWQEVFSAPDYQQPLLDVLIVDERRAFAVGAYGFFLVTEDGGESWDERRVNEEDDWHLNQISRAGAERFYIAAESGTLYRSDDGGQNWQTLPSPYPGSFYGTLPLGEDKLLAYGLRGHVFLSPDAGESWQSLASGTSSLLIDAARLPGQDLVLVGSGGTVLLARAEQATVKPLAQKNRRDLTAVLPLDGNRLLTIGADGLEKIPLQ